MNNFNDILMIAIENIPEDYFETKICQTNEGVSTKLVYRERIYCYELYHQIRTLWQYQHGVKFSVKLDAEFDKSGSGVFSDTSFPRMKPDFLIHSPGETKGNFIAMEVKPSSARKSEIKKDIDKLIELTTVHKFKFGIFLVYGKDAVIKGGIAREYVPSESNSKIIIFTHNEPKSKAVELGSIDSII